MGGLKRMGLIGLSDSIGKERGPGQPLDRHLFRSRPVEKKDRDE